MQQLAFFEPAKDEAIPQERRSSTTFLDNMALPVHRWFRYSAGFSALWAHDVLEAERAKGRTRVFDPFAGSGTTLLEAEKAGVLAIGAEAHPFVARIARAKLLWREPPQEFLKYGLRVLKIAKSMGPPEVKPSGLLEKCFPPHTLRLLEAIKVAWEECAEGGPLSELSWLALISILRSCSPVGTAQWQYVLPSKSKARALAPFEAFEEKVRGMAYDMARCQQRKNGAQARLYPRDVREASGLPENWADLVITSPPYVNNYDYADATRLEMTFMGEIEGWGDLQDAVRVHLVRSCTQHVASLSAMTEDLIGHPRLCPIRDSLRRVCSSLSVERERHGGRKPYDALVAAYFLDMAKVWDTLRRVASPGALVCFVVGDSAPYGVHVPVERWLGELAVSAGFSAWRFEKTRDRNIRWKNRKHRVPLQEGRLWVKG